VVWRRINKKFKSDEGKKKRKRKAKTILKGISGLDKEEI
jgi:hypothetical protein